MCSDWESFVSVQSAWGQDIRDGRLLLTDTSPGPLTCAVIGSLVSVYKVRGDKC